MLINFQLSCGLGKFNQLTPTDKSMALYQIIYISTANPELTEDALL